MQVIVDVEEKIYDDALRGYFHVSEVQPAFIKGIALKKLTITKNDIKLLECLKKCVKED